MVTDFTFGQWLRQRRKSLDLTQEDVARIVQCSVSEIRKLESDERRPSRQIAELLAGSLKIPPAEREIFVQSARAGHSPVALPVPGRVGPTAHRTLPMTNIPFPLTPLLGREAERQALRQLLNDPQCRLLTLVGPGGIGKTRLALEIARDHLHQFQDGIFYVSLSAFRSPDMVVPAIAASLSFDFHGVEDPFQQITEYLKGKKILLILDNAEHLVSSIQVLSQLLRHTQHLKLLITSRERLNLQGEWILDIQGLPVPPLGENEGLERYSAVNLFIQSAKRVMPGLNDMREELDAIGQICRAVDGLPLGIELAAAWVRTLTCQEIASEIMADYNFLSVSARDLPERHRSMRAVFDHSWELLTIDEQAVMMRLAAFRGGFSREAAIRVAGANLPVLAALVEKCMLRRKTAGHYEIHELVRQYANNKLKSDPEAYTATFENHCSYYLGLLIACENDLRGPRQMAALSEIDQEIGNFRLAWDWAIDNNRFQDISQACHSMSLFYEIHGWYREGQSVFENAVETLNGCNAQGPPDPELQVVIGQALTYLGFFLAQLGQHQQALIKLEQALTILRPLDRPGPLADALACLGLVLLRTGDFEQMEEAFQESIYISQMIGYDWNVSLFKSSLALSAMT